MDINFLSDEANFLSKELNFSSKELNFLSNELNFLSKILINFFELKKTKVLRETLIQKGFDFNYFTHIYTTKKGTSYYFCYDYGYLILEDGYYFIVKDLNKN